MDPKKHNAQSGLVSVPSGSTFRHFGCLEGRFGLKIRRRNQPWEIIRPSHAKGTQNDAKWTPGGSFGNTLELEKRHQHVQKVLFCMRLLGVYFRRPPGLHFVRNRVRMTWQKLCLDCTCVSGSHTGHFRKMSSPGSILIRFWRRFGCHTEPLGRHLAEKAVKFESQYEVLCPSYGTGLRIAKTQPRLKSSQRSKSI